MTKYIVEQIRTKAASGLYNHRDIWLSVNKTVGYEAYNQVINYEVMPEVCSNLKSRIWQIEKARGVYSKYQEELRKEASAAMYAEDGGKLYRYEDRKDRLDQLLAQAIDELPEVSLEELRKILP